MFMSHSKHLYGTRLTATANTGSKSTYICHGTLQQVSRATPGGSVCHIAVSPEGHNAEDETPGCQKLRHIFSFPSRCHKDMHLLAHAQGFAPDLWRPGVRIHDEGRKGDTRTVLTRLKQKRKNINTVDAIKASQTAPWRRTSYLPAGNRQQRCQQANPGHYPGREGRHT